MKVIEVYKADNGDIFFKHDWMLKGDSDTKLNVEVENIISELKDNLNKYEIIECSAKYNTNPFKYVSYYSVDGDFLGDSGMHITNKYNQFQDKIYVLRTDNQNTNDKMVKSLFKKGLY